MTSAHIRVIKMRDRHLFIKLLLILFLYFLCQAQAMGASEELATKIERAKNEGKLMIYSSLTLPDTAALGKGFQTKYPFITVEYTRGGGEVLITRILNEAKAKRYIPDIIQTGTFELYVIKKQGLIGKYLSAERAFYDKDFKDSEGYYTTFFYSTEPIIYNSNLVSPDKVPKSYEDLLNPQWRGGKLVFEGGGGASGIRWFISLMNYMGEKKGEEFARKLSGQRLKILRSGSAMTAQLVAAGEYPISIVSSGFLAEDLRQKGAKIEWVRTDPMVTTHTGISLPANTAHPNSAQLYIDFILSKEGQEIIRKLHMIPARSNMEPDPPSLSRGLKLCPYNPEWAEDYDKYVNKFREIFLH